MIQTITVIPAKTGHNPPPLEMGARVCGDDDKAAVAQQFEALLVAQMLKSARAASLADDPLAGARGATFADLIDQTRAAALAAAAPLGVARLLTR